MEEIATIINRFLIDIEKQDLGNLSPRTSGRLEDVIHRLRTVDHDLALELLRQRIRDGRIHV